jgi:hypothetical protein
MILKNKSPGKLWAKYAKMIDKKQFYEARGNVKVINNEGQTFVMQSIYWDKANKKCTPKTLYLSLIKTVLFCCCKWNEC